LANCDGSKSLLHEFIFNIIFINTNDKIPSHLGSFEIFCIFEVLKELGWNTKGK